MGESRAEDGLHLSSSSSSSAENESSEESAESESSSYEESDENALMESHDSIEDESDEDLILIEDKETEVSTCSAVERVAEHLERVAKHLEHKCFKEWIPVSELQNLKLLPQNQSLLKALKDDERFQIGYDWIGTSSERAYFTRVDGKAHESGELYLDLSADCMWGSVDAAVGQQQLPKPKKEEEVSTVIGT